MGNKSLADRMVEAQAVESKGEFTPANTDTLPGGKHYVYNPDTGDYIFLFPKLLTRPYRLTADRLQAMKRAYSDWDGQPATINEICRTFVIQRRLLVAIKNELGWTHDDSPYTDEELGQKGVEELAEDALQQKKQSLFEKFNKQKWQATKDAADKWNNFEQNVFLPLQAKIAEHIPKYKPPMVRLSKAKRPFAALINVTDFHYGKSSWIDEVGDAYSREIARERLITSTERLIQRITAHGKPEQVVVTCGGDYFNSDGDAAMTTGGTPQDNDGTPAQILIEGQDLSVVQIDMLRQVAPVKVVMAAGNHDRINSLSVMRFLWAYYRNTKDVEVVNSPRSRQYITYGNTGILVTHGDGAKMKDLGSLFATEARDVWGKTEHHIAISGHLHYERIVETNGLVFYQFTSLSGSDRWHERKGYTMSRPALGGLLIDKTEGVFASVVQTARKNKAA